MVRSKNTVMLHTLVEENTRPLVGGDGPNLLSALQAIITWATSRSLRERVMAESAFPFPGDLGAFLVVNQLIYRGMARPTDLADAVDTSRPTMSRIVGRLEHGGYVFRAADPRDDRGVVIALTPLGRDLGARILQALGSAADVLPGVTDDDMAELERLLVKVVTAMDALPGHPLATAAGVTFSSAVSQDVV